MRTPMLVSIAVLLLTQGCYLGPNKTARKVAYGVNGAMIVGGIAIAATPDPANCFCIIDNADAGAVPIVLGLAGLIGGLVVNSLLDSHDEVPPPRPHVGGVRARDPYGFASKE